MPYPTNVSTPAYVRKLSPKRQRQWRHIWNTTYANCMNGSDPDSQRCESKAFSVASGVVIKQKGKAKHSMTGTAAPMNKTEVDEYPVFKKLSYQERKNLPGGAYAYTDPEGGKHLPIHDLAHLRNAIARLGQPKTLKQFLSAKAKKALQSRLQGKLERAQHAYDQQIAHHLAAFSLGPDHDNRSLVDASSHEMVLRRGLIFRAGDYPDKDFTLTAKELKKIAKQFHSPVPLDSEHEKSIFDGKLGELVKVEASKDGKELHGLVSIPKWLDPILMGAGGKVSAAFDRASKQLVGLALTINPRVSDAALMAAFSIDQAARGNLSVKELFRMAEKDKKRFAIPAAGAEQGGGDNQPLAGRVKTPYDAPLEFEDDSDDDDDDTKSKTNGNGKKKKLPPFLQKKAKGRAADSEDDDDDDTAEHSGQDEAVPSIGQPSGRMEGFRRKKKANKSDDDDAEHHGGLGQGSTAIGQPGMSKKFVGYDRMIPQAGELGQSGGAKPKSTFTHSGVAMFQAIHDMTATRGAVCRVEPQAATEIGPYGIVRYASKDEMNVIQTIHDTTLQHGASCTPSLYGQQDVPQGLPWTWKWPGVENEGQKGTVPGGMTKPHFAKGSGSEAGMKTMKAFAKFMDSFDGVDPRYEPRAPKSVKEAQMSDNDSDALRRRDEEVERLRVENRQMRMQGILDRAASFADKMIQGGHATPVEREGIITVHAQLEHDDTFTAKATFSNGMSRVSAYEASLLARPNNLLAAELLPSAVQAGLIKFANMSNTPAAPATDGGGNITEERKRHLTSLDPVLKKAYEETSSSRNGRNN